MKITKPLAIIDTETTGTSVTKDKICSIAIKKIPVDGPAEERYTLVDPECHIPAEATAVHNITDEMIKEARDGKGAPTFKQISKSIAAYLEGCVLVSFNGDRFDIPLMSEEFNRVGILFPAEGQETIDCMRIFHEKEKRDLTAAVKFYVDEDMVDAHNALVDVQYTEKVLFGQIEKYDDLRGMTLEELIEFSRDKNKVDMAGKLKRTEQNIIVFNFGKHFEKPVAAVFKSEPTYYDWLKSDKYECPADTMKWFTKIYNHVNKVNVG